MRLILQFETVTDMDFEEALQDILYTPRIWGNFPFDNQFRLSKKLLVYCGLVRLLSAFGAISAFIYPTPILPGGDVSDSLGVAIRCVAVISALGDNFFTLLWWVMKRHRVSFLMESINEIQRRRKICIKRRNVRLVHYLLFLTLATNIFSYFTYINKENHVINTLNEFGYFLSSSSTVCFVGQFWDILHALGFLFRESTQLYDDSSVINYERFLVLCEAINELYGSQILFTITENFLQIILYLYILLLPLFPGFNASNVLIVIQVINCIMPIGTIILACNYYIKQERNFNDDLRRRMIEEKSRVLLKNEKLHFHFVVGHETTFTACGFFNVEMSLICSMISAATTYLVIVLQFGSARSSMHTTANSTAI